MGSGNYSRQTYATLAATKNYSTRSANDIFATSMNVSNSTSSFKTSARTYNTEVDQKMLSVGVRECRDSEEHPNVTPIIIAFDVTGSMGRIPNQMIKEYLPKILDTLYDANIPDPQVMFMAFGDHYTDLHPIQVGQFESDTEKIQNSLESIYLEGRGGGNTAESPMLAYLVAGYHTECDSWFKRNKKGFLFTISDEPCHPVLEGAAQERILGYEKGVADKSTVEIINKAKEQYNVFHIHVTDGCYSVRQVSPSWKELLGDNFITCKSTELLKVIPKLILDNTVSDTVKESTNEPSTEEYVY